MAEQEVLLEVRDLCKNFKVRSRKIGESAQLLHALSHVNLKVYRGETLGVIGESGCGKSTLGRCIVGLHTPSSGQLVFEGKPLNFKAGGGQGKALRRKIQMIFQDPYSSLDPRKTCGKIERMLFGYTRVKKPVGKKLGKSTESYAVRHSCRNGCNIFIFLRHLAKLFPENRGKSHALRLLNGRDAVKLLRIVLGIFASASFVGNDMNNHRTRLSFRRRKNLRQKFYVMPVEGTVIFNTDAFKQRVTRQHAFYSIFCVVGNTKQFVADKRYRITELFYYFLKIGISRRHTHLCQIFGHCSYVARYRHFIVI